MGRRSDFVKGWVELLPVDVMEALRDEERVAAAKAYLEPRLAPGFEISFNGPEGMFEERHVGFDGFLDGWRSWAEPYERFEVYTDALRESGDFTVVDARLVATLAGSSRAIEMHVVGLWRFSGQTLESIEFHLDPARARRIAGLE